MADKFPKEFIVYSPTRASFEAQVASGEVDNTQIGIIAESGEFWEKGNYHPLVMLSDYLKKTDAVTLAKDLTGRIEATPEEFTFRPSAGTKSIRDESAVIRRIKGNTSVWGQLLGEMNADNWNQYADTYTDIEYLENGCKLTILPAYAGGNVYQLGLRYKPTVTHYVSGHKYMVIFDAHVEVSGQMAVETNGTTYYSPRIEAGQWNTTFVTFTRNGTVNNFYFKPPSGYQTTASVGKTYSVRNAMLFDLTALYEAGNEPTTIEKFKKLYPESYYSYCEPEVRSMRATGIETIGANAFNKDSVVGGLINADGTVTSNDIYSVAKIEVVPNETYTLKGVANAVNTIYTYAIYDSRNKVISVGEIKNSVTKPLLVSGDVTMPMTARYLKVVAHSDHLDSCCVNLKHSGTLAPEEATYFKEVRMLPDIATYFLEGMHGIGDVFDEINEENAIKRFGVVDLGTLTWAEYGYTSDNKVFTTQQLSNCAGRVGVMAKYIRTGSTIATMPSGTFKLRDDIPNVMYIADNNYTSLDAFVASLQGVLLYYELAEPIVTPITEPLQMDYKVADFGTEKMVSFYPSSPFRADIVYAFNAADRINDNERNIERIEKQLEPFVREIEVLDGLIGVPALKIETGMISHNRTAWYALPTSSESDKSSADYVLATEDYIRQNMPTEAAPATQVVPYNVSDGSVAIGPNIMYEYQYGVGASQTFVFPSLYSITGDYEKVWMMRLPYISSSNSLSICYSVKWKDGIAPTFSEVVCLEIYLKKIGTDEYIGEWKIYK